MKKNNISQNLYEKQQLYSIPVVIKMNLLLIYSKTLKLFHFGQQKMALSKLP